MPCLSAAPIILTAEQESDLQRLARAHKTPRKLGRTRRDDFALGGGDSGARDRPPTRHLAENRAPMAQPLAERPIGSPGCGAAGGCATLWGAGDVHARAGLRDHGAGLRAAGKERSAAESLEPE